MFLYAKVAQRESTVAETVVLDFYLDWVSEELGIVLRALCERMRRGGLFTSWLSPARTLYQYDILFGFSSDITSIDELAPLRLYLSRCWS